MLKEAPVGEIKEKLVPCCTLHAVTDGFVTATLTGSSGQVAINVNGAPMLLVVAICFVAPPVRFPGARQGKLLAICCPLMLLQVAHKHVSPWPAKLPRVGNGPGPTTVGCGLVGVGFTAQLIESVKGPLVPDTTAYVWLNTFLGIIQPLVMG